MKTAFVLLISVFLFFSGHAQEKEGNARISGKVIDTITTLPLEYATISLFKLGDKKAINGSTSNKDGGFIVRDISTGDYTVIVEFIGYLPVTVNNIRIDQKHASVDLGIISLTKRMVALENVTVTANAKLIDNKIDKLVFNAERDITSQTGVATDVLKKVPQVSVDIDGNVELAGSSSVRFLINGKPSTAFGSNIADVLQSIPANQIKSIEVITNPGAKYDAQGLGGIINIILKKSTAQGVNGNLSLTAGTRSENGSLSLNARKGNFGVNAFFNGNLRPAAKTPTTTERRSSDAMSQIFTTFLQDGTNNVKRMGLQTGIGFDWTLKEKNNFSGSLSYGRFKNNANGMINQLQEEYEQANPSTILSEIRTINALTNRFAAHNTDIELNYKRKFKKEDQELEISFYSSLGRIYREASNTQFLLPQDSLFYGTNSENPGKERETEIEVDYTQPLGKNVQLGFGSKLNFFEVGSNSTVMQFQPHLNRYAFDPSLSNTLDYKQRVYAFYAELSFPIAKTLDAKIGSRYERTEINSFYSNSSQQGETPGYNTLVPSIFFLHKIAEKQTLKLSYSKRIERPDYGDLNPYINTSDPKNIVAGNPYLKPEISDRYELSYNHDFGKAGSFMITLFYRGNHDDIQPFIVYYPSISFGDSTYENVSVTTRENIGLERNMGSNLFADLHITSKLNVRSNLFLFYRHTTNAIDKGYDSRSFNYRLNANATYQFTSSLVGEFFGNFNSARNEAQGKYPSFTTYSLAVRKQFWNKKGSLALTATNFFNKNVTQRTDLFGPNFNTVSTRRIPFRSIGINFTWKFGKLTFKKEEEARENGNLNPPAEN